MERHAYSQPNSSCLQARKCYVVSTGVCRGRLKALCIAREEQRAVGACHSFAAQSASTSLQQRALTSLLTFLTPLVVVSHACLPALAMMPTDSVVAAMETTHTSNAAAHRALDEVPHKVYVSLRINGEDQGPIVIETFKDVPLGTERFVGLARGQDGVSYRSARVDALGQGFIQSSGVKNLSYQIGVPTTLAGGETTEQLEVELAERRHSHAEAGMVSLVVRPAVPRGVRERLVAYQGRLVTVQEPLGAALNGTGFTISTAAMPSLDETNLVVGRVTEGMDVVEAVSRLPRVKENKDSLFFRAAKFAGDKRADVAAKTFGKPFAQVLVADSGVCR